MVCNGPSSSMQTTIPSWGGLQYRLTTWFFYLEIWVRAQAPGLTSSVTQPGVVQAAADSRTGQVFQTGLLPQILLQLGQRPGCESQSQILGMGCLWRIPSATGRPPGSAGEAAKV